MTETTISALYTYPVKSCGGVRHDTAELGPRGLLLDRQWMVIDTANRFVTQREYPAMSLVQTSLSDDTLTLTAPGMSALAVPIAEQDGPQREVVVWKDTVRAIDAGDDAAGWFSEVLHTEVRLVRMPDDYQRLTSTKYTNEPGTLSFADGYPLLFISEGSLVDLNQRLTERGKAPMLMNRFRPNIVFAGCDPYAEDTWQQITIAGIRFDVVKPCARCAITTVDQALGSIPDVKEPLATLAAYRKGANGGVMFGQNALHRSCGTLKIGDTVTIEE